MILPPKNICSGCSACRTICHRSAISMIPDEEGFLYPRVDAAKCVRCGLCVKVCPSINRNSPRSPMMVYAAKARDDTLRLQSSSGGVFSLLARNVIASGGIVFGAGWDKSDWHVVHRSAEDEAGLDEMRGAKYVQSEIGDVYSQVEENAKEGRQVVFAGTPCQVAALRKCLGREYDNLLLVDIVCHAVPSPLVWRRYLECRIRQEDGGTGDIEDCLARAISGVAFRRKKYGWKRYSLTVQFADGREYCKDRANDPYLMGFLAELYNRPSCHDCQCRELRSGSDITLGDFWNVEKVIPGVDDDIGMSLVLLNSAKGRMAWGSIENLVQSYSVDYASAIACNPSIVKSKPRHVRRREFWKRLEASDVDMLIRKFTVEPISRRLRRGVGSVLRKIGIKN